MASDSTIFTPREAKAAAAGQVLHVEGSAGLRLVVSESKKTWIYRYKDTQGRMKQIKLGEWPSMPLSDAIMQWSAKRDMRATGADPAQEKRIRKASVGTHEFETMADMLAEFMDYIDKTRRPDGAKAVRSKLERLLDEEPNFARCPPRTVTRGMAYKILDDRSGYPEATKVLRALLGQATDRALDSGRVNGDTPNWWRLVMHGKLRSKGKLIGGEHVGRAKRVLSESELIVFLPWTAAKMPQLRHDITMLYLTTGLRGVEITGLRVEYITEESDGWWATYPAHLLKMERDRDIVDHRVPLVGLALDIVKRRIAQARDGWLFWTDRGGVFRPYSQSAYGTYVYDIQPNLASVKARRQPEALCPVVRWTAHDLRRTARTILGSMDCPHEVGEAIIGHKLLGVAGTYNLHTYDRQKRHWVPKLVERIEELLKKGQA